MAENIESVIERIRKLMTYANDGSATEAEFENAMGHARRLMDKFNLTEDAVLLEPGKVEDVYASIKEHTGYTRANGIDQFDKRLAQVPCIICDVKCYTSMRWCDDKGNRYVSDRTGRPQQREHLIFYGLPKDCAVAIAMYHELLATMRAMVRFRFPNDWQQHFSSYCTGFVGRLMERAHEARQVGQAESSTTTAIVLRKDVLLDRKRQELGLVKAKSRASRISSGEGFNAGREDGGRVSLGSNQLRGKTQGRLE
jgi:hypothetical protein